MRTTTLFATLVASGAAQLFTPSDLLSIPASTLETVPIGFGNKTVPINRDVQKLAPRDCALLPAGSGPVPLVDTAQAFLSDTAFSNAALSAKTPSGWYRTFQNLQSATSASVYQGYKTYATYDPALCAADCAKISGCAAFNIFFERDPSQDPSVSCPNPSSTTVIKCSFWGVAIGPSTATNSGQKRNDFVVVIAGSNGYQLSAPVYDVTGYNATFTDAATINAPSSCNSYITYKAHTNEAYDPALCATDCAAQALETNPFNGLRCHFFTSYLLVKNGVAQAQICALYSRTWDKSYATNTGYTSGSDIYTIQYAYSYSYTADIGPLVCPQDSANTPATTASTLTTLVSTKAATSTTSTTAITTSTSASSSSVKPTSSATSNTGSSPLKGSPSVAASNWAVNQGFQTLEKVSDGTGLNKDCPTPLNYVVGSQGGLYAVCVDTDFQIPSPQIYYNYQSNQECATKCEATNGCTKAVFNPSTKICYLKGSPSAAASNWAVNQGFQTIVKVADGTALTKCLVPTYTIKVGNTNYQVCPSSDFKNNPATDIWYNVPNDTSCINLCRSRSGCTKIVYNFVTKTCYNKGNPSLESTGWNVNTQFRAIYIS
ncbi:uncharacterized protein CTRU02_200775 [Colletotrichum truncatum]|uniref:Uncharacterized protein n=1 Tax=Colletotrichum truncatum TaxID=5467 RepID=A0ACC3ZFM1_COLTU|nr:uncharacterized protein CTRU02_00542 [Colletotrichum truncatum]KAF6801793.1 hypothetical protein CTRU02_00542 [Colletotrichum truncatum]